MPVVVLDQQKIELKIRRIAVEILERHQPQMPLVLLGINNNGLRFARLIHNVLAPRTSAAVIVGNVRLSPADPLSKPIVTDLDPEILSQAHVIVIDDVANTGRTIFYALQPLMRIPTRKVEVAVLIDRTHKTHPVRPDYVGMSLATTLLEDIQVYLQDDRHWYVTLS